MQVPDESRMHGYDLDGSVQDCSISSANVLEILQSCTEPSLWSYLISSRHDPEDQTNESRECESLCVMAKVGKI